MKQELIVTGSTIEEALRNGAEQLGVMPEERKYEVLVEPKKGILGIGRVAAKLKVCYEEAEAPAEKTTSVAKTAPAKRMETAEENSVALRFVRTLLEDMELEAEATIEETDGEEQIIRISGQDAGSLIGYHGETMDALQYLTNLAANKKSGEEEKREYQKILLDIENYREKRAETLKALARRMAGRVLKYGKNISLEPMSAYERRIIHSEVQGIKGVTTYSVGTDNSRRVVIALDNDEEN